MPPLTLLAILALLLLGLAAGLVTYFLLTGGGSKPAANTYAPPPAPAPGNMPVRTPAVDSDNTLLIDLDAVYAAGEAGLVIGRKGDADIPAPFAPAEISRRHAQIYLRDGQLYIADLNSTNGTLVNGANVKSTGPVVLAEGAELRLGPRRYTVRLRGSPTGPRQDSERTVVKPVVRPPPQPAVGTTKLDAGGEPVGQLKLLSGAKLAAAAMLFSGENRIGREAEGNEVVLDGDPKVSRQDDCRISYDRAEKQFFIRHSKGANRAQILSNGDWVNLSDDPSYLPDGAHLKIGDREFQFSANPGALNTQEPQS